MAFMGSGDCPVSYRPNKSDRTRLAAVVRYLRKLNNKAYPPTKAGALRYCVDTIFVTEVQRAPKSSAQAVVQE